MRLPAQMLVVPPQLLLYLALAPEAKITYKEGGPAAEARFEAGVAGYEARAFRGCGVFTVRASPASQPRPLHPSVLTTDSPTIVLALASQSEPFEVSDDADAVQMLTRNTQVGEFYYMHPPKTMGSEWYPNMLDMIIYDEEADKHVRISWEDAMKATFVDANGIVGNNATVELATEGDATVRTDIWYNQCAAWSEFNKTGKIDNTFGGLGLAAAPATSKATFEALTTYDAANQTPYIAVTRPFIEHMMHSVILTVSGRDTGATLFGPADMQLSANTQVKTIEGHYTGHFKAVITKPQNVYVMRDVAAAGYVAGGNCLWFGKQLNGDFDAATARENLQQRLSFSNDIGAKYRSMLAFPMWESQLSNHMTCLDTTMSVTSRLLPWEVSGTVANGNHTSFPGGQAAFLTYNGLLGLRSIHFGEDMKAAENQDFISQGSTNNALCFIGPHRKYDSFTNSFYSLTPGQGHWGPDAIPGDARWRRGESVSLRAARNSMVSLEVAAHAQMAFVKK